MKSIESKEPITDITGLRKAAVELLNKVINGQYDETQVKLFCGLASNVLSTIKVQMQFISMENKCATNIDFIPEKKLLR